MNTTMDLKSVANTAIYDEKIYVRLVSVETEEDKKFIITINSYNWEYAYFLPVARADAQNRILPYMIDKPVECEWGKNLIPILKEEAQVDMSRWMKYYLLDKEEQFTQCEKKVNDYLVKRFFFKPREVENLFKWIKNMKFPQGKKQDLLLLVITKPGYRE